MKNFFKEQTNIAQKLSESLIDDNFRESLILLPENRYIRESSYIANMADLYSRMHHTSLNGTFYPFEIVAFYPGLLRDFSRVYELKREDLIDVTDSMTKRIQEFRTDLSAEKSKISIIKNSEEMIVHIMCDAVQSINIFSIKKIAHQYYGMKDIIPYIEYINLKPLMKGKVIELLPLQDLTYYQKKWFFRGHPLSENARVFLGACVNGEGRSLLLSDR